MKSHSILPATWDMPDSLRKRLGSTAGRQRIIAEEAHSLIVLHKAPKKDESTREGFFLWRNPNGDWHSSERGTALTSLDDFLENYVTIEQKIDQRYEKASSANDYFALLEELAPLQRSTSNMCKTLAEARHIIGTEMIDYRDKAEELQRSFELLYADCKNGLDYAIAKKTEEQSEMQREALRVGHRLNIIMALFLPMTAIASLLGMNITHGFEQEPVWVFFVIVLVFACLGAAMKTWVMRKL